MHMHCATVAQVPVPHGKLTYHRAVVYTAHHGTGRAGGLPCGRRLGSIRSPASVRQPHPSFLGLFDPGGARVCLCDDAPGDAGQTASADAGRHHSDPGRAAAATHAHGLRLTPARPRANVFSILFGGRGCYLGARWAVETVSTCTSTVYFPIGSAPFPKRPLSFFSRFASLYFSDSIQRLVAVM